MKQGLSISEYGVTEVESGEVHAFADESDLYEFLGYQYIPPELRENAGELEAARRGELPVLVEERDLRGDLHSHTTWSADGRSTMEEMALAAKARGYSYLAVTDHSHYLREGRLAAQAKELAALNAKLKPFRLLHGVEVNIRANGTLDVPDETLAGLDWVVASIHAAFGTNPTERVIAAMENPHVDVIGHLTGRKINKRGADGHRPRARLRGRGRDGHRARDQLPARPAGPARRRRPPRGRARRTDRHLDRRALDRGARLRRRSASAWPAARG